MYFSQMAQANDLNQKHKGNIQNHTRDDDENETNAARVYQLSQKHGLM